VVFLVASMFLVPGCATKSAAPGSESLSGSSWRLVELQSSEDSIDAVRPEVSSKYEMTLAANGPASWQHDCNRRTGTW
jgi:hypothetical protein